jgi:hypothetical protein
MIHWHPMPNEAIQRGTSFKAHCGRFVKSITDDADEVIAEGCKRCQETKGFPDLPPKIPWIKRMTEAGKQVRALAKNAPNGMVSSVDIEAVFKAHGL